MRCILLQLQHEHIVCTPPEGGGEMLPVCYKEADPPPEGAQDWPPERKGDCGNRFDGTRARILRDSRV